MMDYIIDNKESAEDFLSYIKSLPTVVPKVNNNVISFNGDNFEVVPRFNYILRRLSNGRSNSTSRENGRNEKDSQNVENSNDRNIVSNTPVDSISEIDSLIFGKDNTQQIIAAEIVDDEIWLFKNDGSIEKRPHEYWILSSRNIPGAEVLEGGLFYRYLRKFEDPENYKKARGKLYQKNVPAYNIYDPVEAYMVMNGITFFKGLKVNDVSVLSFDIESSGVAHDDNSRVYLISNTFRDSSGKLSRKLFSLDDYDGHDSLMIEKWAEWVQEINPSIMIGHNILGFDLPYLSHCYISRNPHHKKDLILGKDGSSIHYANRPTKIRKDGSQAYDVFNAKIFGRQIIDTWILAIKADFLRKYESYGLKQIIEQEGLKKEDRTLFDFEEVMPKDIWKKFQDGDEEMWAEFKKYCIEDSDDSLKLYDLMIPQYFYYMQSLPMPFQTMNMTATGRQINGFLCRSYLQTGHSIPRPSEKEKYEGAISFGNPGVYAHVYKVDVASLYPSIMITEEIYDEEKDPKGNFLTMVKYFTKERLENKKKAAETGDRYFKDIEQAQKIVINSAYGLLGATGLHFNSMKNADKTTRIGREILTKGIDWVNEKGYEIVNVDTDAFSYTSGKKKTKEDFAAEIEDINSRYKDGIVWEDDGYYTKFIVVKAKNYIIQDEKKNVKIKGSGLKATGKEKALQDFTKCVIMLLLKGRRDSIFDEYRKVGLTIKNDWNVEDWVQKRTITKSVLNPNRTQEQKVLDAIQNIHYQEGDKVYVYCKDKDTLKLRDEFDGEYHADTYFKKLHDTLSIFETLLDPTLYPKYSLGRNRELL